MADNEMDKDLVSSKTGYSTYGSPIKGGSIVTGMDKLVNPKATSQVDTIFDSSPSRGINEGSVMDQGGIQYKGLNNGNPLK